MTKKKAFFNNLKLLIVMCIKTCPAYTMAFFFVSMSYGLMLVLGTKVSQYFFDIIAAAHSKSYAEIIISIIVFGLTLIIQQILNGFLNFMGWHMEIKVNKKMLYAFHNRAALLKPVLFESATELDRINKASRGAKNTMEVCGTILMLITFYVPYFLFMSIHLFLIKPVLMCIMIFIFLPNLFTQYVHTKIFSDLENKSAPIRRKIQYYQKCVTQKEVRHCGSYFYFRNLLKENIDLLGNKIWEVEKKVASWEAVLNLCTITGYICVIYVLTYNLINHQISIGAFAAIFGSIDTMYSLMNEIICFHFGNLAQNISMVNNFIEFIEENQNNNCKKAKVELTNGITTQNLAFIYPNETKMALKNINLEIKPGEKVAIVGENGAGKSTLLKLLTGLYEPTEGAIYSGKDEITNNQNVLKRVSAVFQQFERYKMTFRDNISISNIYHVIDDEIMRIADRVEALPALQLDDVLDTMLSREFGGIELSGGKWQRIAIARGLYKHSDIIIFDEPTAAIDPIEETHLYHLFSKMAENKTAIIITHRLGAVKIADRIVLLENGEVKEQGTHLELIKLNGIYAKMYNMQSEGYQ